MTAPTTRDLLARAAAILVDLGGVPSAGGLDALHNVFECHDFLGEFVDDLGEVRRVPDSAPAAGDLLGVLPELPGADHSSSSPWDGMHAPGRVNGAGAPTSDGKATPDDGRPS